MKKWADDLDVCMVSEALKRNSSLYYDQRGSYEDELLCTPQQDSAIVAEVIKIQSWVRGMINRGIYLRQRQMAIRIQSWQRSSSIRSGYKKIRANVTVIQGIVRQRLTQRNPQSEDFHPKWKDAVGECYGVTIIPRTELKAGVSTSSNRPAVRYKGNEINPYSFDCSPNLHGNSEKNGEKMTPEEEKMVSRRGRY